MPNRGAIAVACLCVNALLTCGAGPTSQPTAAPATAPAAPYVSAARYNALKKDRDALAEQLALATEQIARLHKENDELRRTLHAATRPARQ